MKNNPFEDGCFQFQNERYVSFTKEFGKFIFAFGIERNYDFENEVEIPCEYKLVIDFRPKSNNIEDILFGFSSEYFSFKLSEILPVARQVISFIKELKEEYIIDKVGYNAYDISPAKRKQKMRIYDYFLSQI